MDDANHAMKFRGRDMTGTALCVPPAGQPQCWMRLVGIIDPPRRSSPSCVSCGVHKVLVVGKAAGREEKLPPPPSRAVRLCASIGDDYGDSTLH